MMTNDGAMSETESQCRYDVFLSFSGEDTRHTFTSHLYHALCRKGIPTFMDDGELQLGDHIAPALLKAIQESRISVVVFSQNYADSSWCLDELVKIHECMKSKNQLLWPIFYKVDPSDVRHQNGNYAKAMTKHEKRFGKDSEKVLQWRSTLTHIANLKALQENRFNAVRRDESKFIDDLVSKIFIKLSPKDLSSDEHIVGREDRVEELKSLLDLENHNITCLLGIHGTGGIGKTTLAKALYDSVYNKFEGSSFLSHGLKHLQERLLTDILEVSKIKLRSTEDGIKTIKSRLGFKRVLIVLDDVDNIEQLNNLIGREVWFGHGSRIIITTRDKHLLDLGQVNNRYEVKVLNDQESLELFCQSAFRKSFPETNYEYLSNRAMRCCKGLPLALNVLGSHLVGKDFDGWKDALDRYEKSPHEDVQKVLRISYDSLAPNEKNIFLDIACFFKGHRLEYIRRVLDACDFSSGDGITTLVNKSLLSIDNNCLGMHDLMQAMGREIVKEEAWNEVGERSRLWNHEDVLQVLLDDNGSSKIQGIMLDGHQREEEITCVVDTVFEKMKNLRILIVCNSSFSLEPSFLPNNLRLLDWKYPSQSFPSGFYPRKIGSFNLSGSPLLVLEKPFQVQLLDLISQMIVVTFQYLAYMNISYCPMVTEFPDVSGAMNLRELRLDGCQKLVSIHKSAGYLVNLVLLSASGCYQLPSFVPTMYLPSLQYLSFELCSRLAHFPKIDGTMDESLEINISYTDLKELPESIEKLVGLKYLDMTDCKGLQHYQLRKIPELPSSVEKVDARECKCLTSQTSNILWCQVRKEIKRLKVKMPHTEIPEWFDYVNNGGYPVIKARGKFPVIALAFVFRDVNAKDSDLFAADYQAVGMELFVEGKRRRYNNFTLAENHVFLCDLRVLFSLGKWEDVGVGGGNDWKTIKIYCKTEMILCSRGVYVYKHETNMEDIQFTSQRSCSYLVRRLDTFNAARSKKQSLKWQDTYLEHDRKIRSVHELNRLLGIQSSPEGTSVDKDHDSQWEELTDDYYFHDDDDDDGKSQETGHSEDDEEESGSACRSGKRMRRC
ncbi:unnamed protein product [Sphenostylis stenocarpa]|uniref:ADP-ribosyl cyclase/cyclic ADP-ribose hydrolase n=1 Tax=Sphenostylis stenocarpa TaxID=92480 RepID=A0AA86VDD4_9FABA|nr:unnamed protein product [Sphenostylis stenocarpa]